MKDEDYLKDLFLEEARILDVKRGYISAASFNLRMRPEVLTAAGRLIADFFKADKIEVVHGIPHSGVYLATAVAQALGDGIRLHVSRKDQVIPAAWKEVVRAEVRSFTASGEGNTIIGSMSLAFVRPGERILVVDDVCATGQTAGAVIEELQKRKVEVVGLAVLFDKAFQGGLEMVKKLGVKTYSCVTVENVTGEGEIILAD